MEHEIDKALRELKERIEDQPSSREISLALTKLDECRLWINEAFRVRKNSDQ